MVTVITAIVSSITMSGVSSHYAIMATFGEDSWLNLGLIIIPPRLILVDVKGECQGYAWPECVYIGLPLVD